MTNLKSHQPLTPALFHVLLALADGEKHGYAISEWIEAMSDGSLLVEEGTLSPALHRLARQRRVVATWGVSENNRRAKYYALTRAGHKKLAEEQRNWARASLAIARVLESA